jgi:ankyrin repeat protein
MASETDRSFVEPLPADPNLKLQQKRARELLRAARASDADALLRIRTLHPKPPAADTLQLADAQLVVARGYGFENWAEMKHKIESLTITPVEQFMNAVREGDVPRVRQLLESHADVRAAVNAPIGHFGGRPVMAARKNLPLIDLLLEYGADLNLKSDWWAGPFGLLEHGCTLAEAAPLIARGCRVDVFAAAHLGMFDHLRRLVDVDPSLVHARGGDGKTPLHCASTVEIAAHLLDRGADIDARDVDHESTPAQYLVRDAPDVTRLLVQRGAWIDIFIAIGLRDRALVDRCLREDPEALDHRIWHGKYTVVHNGERASTREEIGDHRGDVYRWVFGHNASALDVAIALGYDEIVEQLQRHASPAQRLLAACAKADRAAAAAVVASHPNVVAGLTNEQKKLIVDKAHANDTAAVELMLDLGFDPLARGVDGWEPIRWAAFHGNAKLVKQLLAHNPPLNVPDPSYGGTSLGQCLYGAMHGWSCEAGDFATTVRLLLEAGERADPTDLPTGRDDVDAVLREHFSLRNLQNDDCPKG